MRKRLVLLGCATAFGLACGPNDAEIARAVQSSLGTETDLQGNSIDVASVDGEVTLTGSVDSTAERAHAQSVAEGVAGVRTVRNQLTVDETALAPPNPETPPSTAPPPNEMDEGTSEPPAGDAEGAAEPTPDPRPQGGATEPGDESAGS